MKRKQHDISVKLRVLIPCEYADHGLSGMQRYNVKMDVTKATASGKEKTREPRNDEATRLLLQYSQQQAQVEGQIAAARQSAGIATERMTERINNFWLCNNASADWTGKN